MSQSSRLTIYDIAGRAGYPTDIGLCGRLDYRTSGVMLMTDDAILNRAIRDPPNDENESDDFDDIDEEISINQEALQQKPFQEQPSKEVCMAPTSTVDKYLEYKSKVYLVKVTGEKLNDIAATTCHNNELQQHALRNLLEEISLPFQFIRHHIIRQTTSAQISIRNNLYQDDTLRTSQRPHRGWCLDLEICIREGKHHQIRRMIRRSHLKLLTLCRIQIASILRIESVPSPGDCRWLEEWEVDEIYHALQIKTEEVDSLPSV